ncbi:MAG TPA: hypothetical protein VFD89_00170 [Clostridia bacterium]|nr:hypothetical protein [Clostridia bacterium]
MKSGRIRWGLALCIILGFVIGAMLWFNGLLAAKVYPAFQAFRGYRILQSVPHYEREQVGNFTVRYDSVDFDRFHDLEEIIDEYGGRVLDLFDYAPVKAIDVILFSDEGEFHQSLGIPMDQPTIGAYSGGKIAVLERSLDGLEENMLINSFVHELTHLVVDNLAGGNFPVWFTEGSALYIEHMLLGYEWGQELGVTDTYSIEELTDDFYGLDEYRAYRQAFIEVRAMIERIGWDGYLDLLRVLKDGSDPLSQFMKF